MRPLYETDADRSRERSVVDYLTEKHPAYTYKKTPDLHCADWLMFRNGERYGLVEIKTRTNEYRRYPTYMLSARKWLSMLSESKKYDVRPYLIVKFTDGHYVTMLKEEYPVQVGGRTDRNDLRDKEKCIFIPIEEFKPI